jgi:hypothetical protein
MAVREPSRSFLRELNDAAGNARFEVRAAVKKHVVSLLLLLYPEWVSGLMDAITAEHGEQKRVVNPEEYLAMTPDEQEDFLVLLAGGKPKKRRVN